MTVFVDTSAFLAFLNETDRYYEQAVSQWRSLLESDEPLVSNNYVLVETIALVQHRLGLAAIRGLHDGLIPLIAIQWVDEVVHGQAMAAMMAANRRQLSLVDCSAMATMRSLGINRILTFDPHFADYGFTGLSQ
jgi:predicted nucleic acid-binding protein